MTQHSLLVDTHKHWTASISGAVQAITLPIPARSSLTAWSAGSSELEYVCPVAVRLPVVPAEQRAQAQPWLLFQE